MSVEEQVEENTDPSAHVKLALSIASEVLKKFDPRAYPSDHDMFGEAMLGLVLASKDYDPEKRSFATWAQYKIRGRIGIYAEKELAYRKRRSELDSLELILSPGSGGEFGDDDDLVKMSAKKRRKLSADTWSEEDRADLRDAIEHVGGMEAVVLKARMDNHTLAEIGAEYNITRERVRQIEKQGIEMTRARVGLQSGEVWA
jgi:RNA polymerase sigma factor (sigma-70 family)